MEIKLLPESDHYLWDNYVTRHPNKTFFHLTGWKKVVEKSFGHKSYYLMAIESNSENSKIVGCFPLFSIKSFLFGKCLVSIPFATYGGILANNDNIGKALYEEAVRLTKKESLDYLEIRNEKIKFGRLPTKDLYYVFKKEIHLDSEANLKAIPRKTRRMVRLGIKNELQSSFGTFELLDQFYNLFAYNYRSLGTPVFSKKYIKNLLEEFGNQCSILIISKNGYPLSGVLSFYFKDEVIPYYSGAYPESRKHAANNYLYWVLMSDAAQKGFKVFDFGRSKKDTGSFNFKKHWGFESKLLPYQYYLNKLDEIPNVSPANPKYKRCIELWKKLPLWVTKVVGPRIVKYIP